MTNPALQTDAYEFSMLDSFVKSGMADKTAVFEAFTRKLPTGRRYGVFAGIARFFDALEDFKFSAEDLDTLEGAGFISPETRDWLTDFKFSAQVRYLHEGDFFYPNTPLVNITGRLGECVLVETLLLSILNHDSAVASAASRMRVAAGDRSLIEMGGRRVQEDAAVSASRAAYLAGFDATSNVAASKQYEIPLTGTAAHAFTLAHKTEEEAFANQVKALGTGTTLLVDTYDIEQGIRNAVEAGGPHLGGIRIDSGDLRDESTKARALLDSLGATDTKIVVSSDLDEFLIAGAGRHVDVFGAGTRVVTGSGHPTCGMVYKLVAIQDEEDGSFRAVAKKASGKASVGGSKTPYRYADGAEGFSLTGEVPEGAEALFVTGAPATLQEARAFHTERMAQAPAEMLKISAGEPYTEAVLDRKEN